LFNLTTGLWPLLHLRSFEAVSGPKTDRWLVKTVAGLVAGNGLVQIGARDSATALAQARRIGLGTAVTLAAIDLTYAPAGRISRVYLVDAALQVAWTAAWLTGGRRPVRDLPEGWPTSDTE
jgi:hypothetical protein